MEFLMISIFGAKGLSDFIANAGVTFKFYLESWNSSEHDLLQNIALNS